MWDGFGPHSVRGAVLVLWVSRLWQQCVQWMQLGQHTAPGPAPLLLEGSKLQQAEGLWVG